MVTINLLPWREDRNIVENRTTKKILLAVIFIPLFMMGVIYLFVTWRADSVRTHLAQLKNDLRQITAMQNTITLNDHPVLTTALHKNMLIYQAEIKNLLFELGRHKQSGICFSDLVRAGNSITFSGYANSAAEFTDYLRHWPAAHLFSDMYVDQLQQDDAGKRTQFRFHAIERHSFPR